MRKLKQIKNLMTVILLKIGLMITRLRRLLTTRKELSQADMWKKCEELPVKIFYKILQTNNLNLLIKNQENQEKTKVSQERLNSIWIDILDEYSNLTNESKNQANLRKLVSLLKLQNQYTTIRAAVILCDFGIKKGFETLKYFKLNSVEAGKHQLNILKTKIKLKIVDITPTKEADYNFYKELATLEQILGRSINQDISVSYWIELNKLAKNIANERNKK